MKETLKNENKENVSEKGKDVVRMIQEYVSANYDSEIKLQDLASKQFFFNEAYLCRLFHSETGLHFSKYLLQVRMDKAMELLKTKKIKVKEVAQLVGYVDTSSFIQKFKEYHGNTPRRYK